MREDSGRKFSLSKAGRVTACGHPLPPSLLADIANQLWRSRLFSHLQPPNIHYQPVRVGMKEITYLLRDT